MTVNSLSGSLTVAEPKSPYHIPSLTHINTPRLKRNKITPVGSPESCSPPPAMHVNKGSTDDFELDIRYSGSIGSSEFY